MAYNNSVILTGNLGTEARIIEQDGTTFVAVSMATADSYKDEAEQWVQKETIWHNILAFSPHVVQQLKAIKQGTRIQVHGSLSYKEFPFVLEDGRTVNKKEVSIIAHKVELKPLVKKQQ